MEDIIGKRFGKLIVIKFIGYDKYKHKIYLCKCDCGKEKEVKKSHLIAKTVQSCGCLKSESKNSHIIGKKFGKLQVIEKTEKRKNTQTVWKCKCDCGNIVEFPTSYLTDRDLPNCGCETYKIRKKQRIKIYT